MRKCRLLLEEEKAACTLKYENMAAICRPTRRLICVKMRLFADSGSAAI